MMIGPDSPLRRVPDALDRKQVLFIDAIRFSIEMADVAHDRLREALLALSMRLEGGEHAPETPVSAMLDAWSIIDSLHRLHRLVLQMPGLTRRMRVPAIRKFVTACADVEALRNTVQHLDNAIPEWVDQPDWIVWGSLSWGVVEPETGRVKAYLFVPVKTSRGKRPIVNPLQRRIWHNRVDLITLESCGVSVCLSDLISQVVAVTRTLEHGFERAFASQLPDAGHGPADTLFGLVMEPAATRAVASDG